MLFFGHYYYNIKLNCYFYYFIIIIHTSYKRKMKDLGYWKERVAGNGSGNVENGSGKVLEGREWMEFMRRSKDRKSKEGKLEVI